MAQGPPRVPQRVRKAFRGDRPGSEGNP
ncbi:uncharacterized protein G2W53_001039 [Senna tora]|uniref:Uncharacterized protein n=1 Tax=Senna tora TaxID=362788 RepID=A0A834XF67_9FABA|nr:uncharacterized protein G2W53_001039 [Senna tora]